MPEVVADLPFRVVDTHGQEFCTRVAGEQRRDGVWKGWLEFARPDELDALFTRTETTQRSRAALEEWAHGLSEMYVQKAFKSAIAATTRARIGRRVSRRRRRRIAANTGADLPDPFQLFSSGREKMRLRLEALPRRMLLEIIGAFTLNPAGLNLSWLNDKQLVTFIITAVDVQLLAGRH